MTNIKLLNKVEKGKNISPVLPKKIKNYLIDIDGTICDDIPNEQPDRMEKQNFILKLLKLLISGIKKVILLLFLPQD